MKSNVCVCVCDCQTSLYPREYDLRALRQRLTTTTRQCIHELTRQIGNRFESHGVQDLVGHGSNALQDAQVTLGNLRQEGNLVGLHDTFFHVHLVLVPIIGGLGLLGRGFFFRGHDVVVDVNAVVGGWSLLVGGIATAVVVVVAAALIGTNVGYEECKGDAMQLNRDQ